MADEVGRSRSDIVADEFVDHAEDGFSNAFVDRPACLALLGHVRDRSAGTSSPRHVCRTRVSARMTSTRRLDWIADDAFDIAYAPAIEHVDERA